MTKCDEELRAEAIDLLKQLESGELDADQRTVTITLLAEILFPNTDEKGLPGLDLADAEAIAPSQNLEAREVLSRMDEEEANFAKSLRQSMEAKGLTQAQLADAVGIGQPAVSMILNRSCPPQRKTVLRLRRRSVYP